MAHLSHDPANIARGANGVAADARDDSENNPSEIIKVPAEVMLGLATSVIASQRQIIAERDRYIATLERLLKLAADTFRPAGTVLQ